MMRVIIGLPTWNLSGVAVFAAELARGLNAAGWDARILLTQAYQDEVEHSARFVPPADVPVNRLALAPTDDWDVRWHTLIRYLEEHAPCIFLPNHDWRMSVVSARLSSRVHVVGVLHTDLPVDYDHVKRLGQYWNAIVGVSETIRCNSISSTAYFAERTVVIPYGVDIPAALPARAAADSLKIIYHGALRYQQKRVFDLVRIAEGLARRNVPFELTIVGDGAAGEELRARAAPLVERGLVHFLPLLPNDQVLPLVAQQNVFLLTSEYEGLPLALLEAMGRGCVPVVSDLPTLSPPVQHGVNGFRVPVGQIEMFVERLTELARNPSRRMEMGTCAYETVSRGPYHTEDMVRAYADLFERVQDEARRGLFQRPSGTMLAPPEHVGVAQILPGNHYAAAQRVNRANAFPSPVRRSLPQPRPHVSRASRNLEDYRIIFGTISGRISGVDTFTLELARALRARGFDASILFTLRARKLKERPGLVDVPLTLLPAKWNTSWYGRWQATTKFLTSHAPCIYLPNYDWHHSCVTPLLPEHVKVVGIAHSDDPDHYEHAVRLGRYWDAIVGVSPVITNEIRALDASLGPRLHTIPYGVSVPTQSPRRAPRADKRLRIVYAGRIVQHQKRVMDLIRITRALVERQVPFEMTIVGDGTDQTWFLEQASDLIANYQLRAVGALPNSAVQQLLAQSDVFLLTSAFEGLSISMLEAMAQGCVPVVTDIRSGVPETIRDGENGFVVPVADIDAFVERLVLLEQNPELREQMGQRAHETIQQRYRLDQMADHYLDLFRSVLTQEFIRPRGKLHPPPSLTRQTKFMARLPRPLRRFRWYLPQSGQMDWT